MNFEEHAAKPLLAAAGIATPPGAVAVDPVPLAPLAFGEVVIPVLGGGPPASRDGVRAVQAHQGSLKTGLGGQSPA